MTTKDEIQLSINSRLQSPATKIEGGTIQDIVGSVAYELAKINDTKIDFILDNAFVSTADIEHLLIRGKEYGIERREAVSAFVIAKITNASPFAVVDNNIRAMTESGLIFAPVEKVIVDEKKEALVKMQCTTQGVIGNIKKGELNRFYASYEGFSTAQITNEEEGYDGFEIEDVEEYRQRILKHMRENGANSNIADYIKWAKSVSGVYDVVVKDALQIGAGNVYVYISAENDAAVSDELRQSVKEYIEKEQIINAKVSVFALEYKSINIEANIILKEGFNLTEIKNGFEKLLKEYFISRPKYISYLYISNLLFSLEGVEDVQSYLINGSAKTLELTDLQIPVAGEVTVKNIGEE